MKDYLQTKEGKPEQQTFGRREIRQALRVSKASFHRYVTDLEDLEYLQKRGSNQYKGYQYQIVYWDDYQSRRARLKKYLNEQIKAL